jgi:fucose permease
MNPALLRRGLVPAGLFFAGGSLLASIGPLLPTLAERSGRPVAELGIYFTLLALGTIIGSSLFGGLAERFGVGPVLAAGSVLHALAMLLLSLVSPYWLQAAAVMLAGFGYSAIMAGANIAVVLLFPQQSTQALNAVNVFFGIGSMAGPLLAAAAASAGLAATWAVWPGALLLLLLFRPVSRLARPQAGVVRAPRDLPVRVPLMLALGLMMFFYVGIEVALGGWLSWLLEEAAGRSAAAAAAGTSLYWLGLTLGRTAGAFISGRVAPRRMLLAVLILLLLGLIWLWIGLQFGTAVLPAILLLGIASGPIFPSVMALMSEAAAGSSRGIGLSMAVGSGGGIFMPALVGYSLVNYGPTLGLTLLAAAAVVIVALLAYARRNMQTPAVLSAAGI